MTYPCAVTADLKRHLAKIDRADRREEAIENEVERLMEKGEDYYPWSTVNLGEALSELAGDAFDRVQREFEAGNVAVAGGALYYGVLNYWKHLARNKAETTVDAGCHECWGRGCPQCDEDARGDHREH